MFPEGFIKRIKNQEYIDTETLLRALEDPSPVSIRINPSKLNKRPLNSEPVPWCETGYYLPRRPSYTFDPLFHSGCYYPQEASGMFLEQVFLQKIGKRENIRILDLCGAPGGKSTHLSSLIGRNGLLVSNEVIRSRAMVLMENISKWGVSNTLVTQNDPSALGKLTGYFDVVFVDAPCSGEGMFRDDVARREWSEKNAMLCSERQKRILMDIWPSLKENGILIYSTCTFNPGENEDNIKWLIEKQKAETERLDITGFSGIKEIDYRGVSGYGFYPDTIRGEGFFLSVMRKMEKSGKNHINSTRNKILKAGREDIKIAVEWTLFHEGPIVRIGDDIYKLPVSTDEFGYLSQNLRIIMPGTWICSVRKKDFLPSHELALSDGLKKEAFPVRELDYSNAIAYLKRENIKVQDLPGGWFITAFNGIPLGFAKNLGTRINNYYPVKRRIRMNKPLPGSVEMIKW
jgi:16S rRNA C967 or C1407 C5-methylase (RsmB/RsmF family)/NOL1/NOP2/fmu family ribosome biogenesis protein